MSRNHGRRGKQHIHVSPLIRLSVPQLAGLIRDRDVSVAELVGMHLDRIAAVQPTLRALLRVNGERAMERARVLRPHAVRYT
jgi:hypothetical protein